MIRETVAANAANAWVKLECIGDVFKACQSPDGAAWTLVGSETIPRTSGARRPRRRQQECVHRV
jgi:hypothetical protein